MPSTTLERNATPAMALRKSLLKKGEQQHLKDMNKTGKIITEVLQDIDIAKLRTAAWKSK